MSRADRAVSMHLFYRNHADRDVWQAVVDTVIDWDESARPQSIDRISGPRAGEESPWTDADRAELVALLAGDEVFMWDLPAGEDAGLSFSQTKNESRCTLLVDGNATSIADRYCALLAALPEGVALGFGYHADTDDEACELLGLARLTRVPAVLHVSASDVSAEVAASPCEVRDLGPRGLVLVAGKKAKAVARHLGISEATPWVLL